MIKPYAIDKHSTQMTFTLEQGAQVCFMTRSVRSSWNLLLSTLISASQSHSQKHSFTFISACKSGNGWNTNGIVLPIYIFYNKISYFKWPCRMISAIYYDESIDHNYHYPLPIQYFYRIDGDKATLSSVLTLVEVWIFSCKKSLTISFDLG